jgi:hypothetical protein
MVQATIHSPRLPHSRRSACSGAAVDRGPRVSEELFEALEKRNMRLSETIAASSALVLLVLRSRFPDDARDSMPFIH